MRKENSNSTDRSSQNFRKRHRFKPNTKAFNSEVEIFDNKGKVSKRQFQDEEEDSEAVVMGR